MVILKLTYNTGRLGNGIFSSDGTQWEFSRALLRPQFVRDQVSDLELEENHVQHLMKALPAYDNDGWTKQTDLMTLFLRLTLDSSTEFLFGESGATQSQLAALPGFVPKVDGPSSSQSFGDEFDKSLEHLSNAGKYNDMYWMYYFWNSDFRRSVKAVHEFCDFYVQQGIRHAKTKGTSRTDDTKKKYVFLEALAEETQDAVMLRSQLLSILLAGRDTTASLLSFLFLLLAQHPDVFQKLRTAILDHFGDYKKDPRQRISFASLKACSYLQYCLMETLRLYPAVPVNSRESIRDTTIPRGGGPNGDDPIFIPKGVQVNYSVYVMHRRKDLWGEDANEFRPDRWTNRKTGWEYLPFNVSLQRSPTSM